MQNISLVRFKTLWVVDDNFEGGPPVDVSAQPCKLKSCLPDLRRLTLSPRYVRQRTVCELATCLNNRPKAPVHEPLVTMGLAVGRSDGDFCYGFE